MTESTSQETDQIIEEKTTNVSPKRQKLNKVLQFLIDKTEFPRFFISGCIGTALYFFASEGIVYLLTLWGVGDYSSSIGTTLAYIASIIWQHALHR